MRPYGSPSNGGVSGCGLDPLDLLKWRTCARLCWARARQARPPRLRLFSFPVRPPGGGRPRASDESARGGAMSKSEQPQALGQSFKSHLRRAGPPGRGDFWISENCSCPLSQKPVQKWFCPIKGGSLCVKDAFAKKFFGAGRDSLSAPAPARRAAASEPKAPPCPLNVRAHHGARLCWRKSTC